MKDEKIVEEEKTEECSHGECCCNHEKEKGLKGLKNKKKHGCNHEELEQLKNMVEELKNANLELQQKLMYTQADAINYRKRKDEEVSNTLKYANQDLILDLLEMIENLDRASSVKTESEEAKKIVTGISMTSVQFKEILKKYGVVEIEALEYPFDPNYMEAMMVDKVLDKPDGMVLEVLIKGYKYKDRVIKPAVVKVNKLED